MKTTPIPFLVALTFLMLLPGCVGYRLGSQLPRDIQTVFVHLAANETDEPLLEAEVTQAVMNRIRRDGSLRVTTEQDADAHMFIEITGFEITPLAFDPQNRARPDEYRLELTANTVLTRRREGTVLVRTASVKGRSIFNLQGDLTASKRTAVPDAADDLARRLVAAVTEAWPE